MSVFFALAASTCALNAVTCTLLSDGSFVMPDWFAFILLFSVGLALFTLPFRMLRILIPSRGGDK